ncbi:MAG: DNA polymerase III subunit gamma/tau [Eubacteriales bacterium]
MSYAALYRKFRPDHFEDVKGQEHIVTTLRNQIKSERIGHAYLFCGTRGTGKTTIAKLLAKAVNCENPVDGSPCGECSSCKRIGVGASMNVIEIDAASNNGVDNIREIVDQVSYSPADDKFKVYIIDEVHMLSIGAFNALLKTLEEPPSYVIFILATTEVHKIPITILSRCQRYDFKRITVDTIVQRLEEVIEKEQVQVEAKALRFIAKNADGAMRDALSLLDQCLAFHFGEKLTYEMVLNVLGAVDTEVFSKLLGNILDRNVLGCIELLEEIVIQGREFIQFIIEFTWYLRNLLLVKTSENVEDIIDVSKENLMRLKEEAIRIDLEIVMRYIRIFSELSNQIKYATQKRIMVEMALIKLCKPEMEVKQDALLERIRIIEDKIENGVITRVENITSESNQQNQVSKPMVKELPKAIPDDIKKVISRWSAIVSMAHNPLKNYLKTAKLSLGNENQLLMVFTDGLASDYVVKQEENKGVVEQLIADVIGKQVEVSMQIISKEQRFEDSYIDLSQIVHMEIEIEE